MAGWFSLTQSSGWRGSVLLALSALCVTVAGGLTTLPAAASGPTAARAAGAVPITVGGSAVTVTVTAPATQATLSFSVTTATTVAATFVSWTFPVDGAVSGYLADSSGKPVGDSVSLDGKGPLSAAPHRLAAGSYEVVVDIGSSGASGSATVQLTPVGSITMNGAAVPASIGSAAQPQLLAFSATAGLTVVAAATQSSFGLADGATLGIENAAGLSQGAVEYVGDAGATYAVATLRKTGTYYIALRPAIQGTSGSAVLSLRSAGPPVTATVGGPAVSLAVTSPGLPATATFPGTAGETVGVVIHSTTFTGSTTRIYVTGSDGLPVGPDQYLGGTATADGPVTLPSSGSYTVVVDPGDTGTTGTVSFSLVKVTDVQESTAVNGNPVTATITQPTQRAMVTFTARAGEKVVVLYSASTLTAAGDTIALDGPTGSVIDSAAPLTGSAGHLLPATLPAAGTYTVVVDPSAAGDTGAITISVKSITDITGTITAGTAVTVSITTPGQRAFYSFTTTASTQASFTVADSTFTGATSLYVIDSTGAVVGGAYFLATDGDQGPISITEPGTYQVVIDPTLSGSDETGTLSLTLTETPPAQGARAPDSHLSVPPPARPQTTPTASGQAPSTTSPGPTITVTYSFSVTNINYYGYSNVFPGYEGEVDSYNGSATWNMASDGTVTGTGSYSDHDHTWYMQPGYCHYLDDTSSSAQYSGPVIDSTVQITPPAQPGDPTSFNFDLGQIFVAGTAVKQTRYTSGFGPGDVPCQESDSVASDPLSESLGDAGAVGSIPAGQDSASGHYSGCENDIGPTDIPITFYLDECSTNWTITLPPKPAVLGLGDSVTAGYGLGLSGGHYSGHGDNPSAYPAVLAKDLGIPYENYAVEGACASSATGRYKEYDCQDRASLLTQIKEVPSDYDPSLIVLSVGADDIDFSACIRDVMFYDKKRTGHPEPDPDLTWSGNRCNAKNLDSALTSFDHNFEADLGQIAAKFPGAKVLVMDYYDPFPAAPRTDADTCELFSDAALANEYAKKDDSWESAVSYWFKDHSAYLRTSAGIQTQVAKDVDSILGELNGAINDDVAEAADNGLDATVVGTGNFDGHDVCAGKSAWIFSPKGELHLFLAGFNPFTYHFDAGRPTCIDASFNELRSNPAPVEIGKKEIFAITLEFKTNCMPHPTAEGQQQLANDFLTQEADQTRPDRDAADLPASRPSRSRSPGHS